MHNIRNAQNLLLYGSAQQGCHRQTIVTAVKILFSRRCFVCRSHTLAELL